MHKFQRLQILMKALQYTLMHVSKEYGRVLIHKDHLISYESTKLKENEHNYVTHDMFLIAIIHPLKMWRHYLMGKKFELRTDHDGLKHLFQKPTLNSR